MASKELKELIIDYLEQAKLMQLATSIEGQPWACTVYFAYDNDLNIYWFSSSLRRHSKEVLVNKKVAAAISLPLAPQEKTRGVSLQGTAELLTKQEDIDKAISVYVDRIFPIERINNSIKTLNHCFYRIKPTLFVLFDVVNFPDNPRQELRI